jgi:hypothetical protein
MTTIDKNASNENAAVEAPAVEKKIPAILQKLEAFKATFDTAAAHERNIKEQAQAVLSQQDEAEVTPELRAQAKKNMQRAATHERFNEALRDMSEAGHKALAKYKVDAEALAKQSRELKKRSIAILEALGSQAHVNDRALDAVLQFIVEKNPAVVTLEQVRKQMQHETTTQAQYFKTCAIFFKFGDYSKSEKQLILKSDAPVLRDLLKLYAAE